MPLPSEGRADISWQTCFPSCGSWPALGSNPLSALPFPSQIADLGPPPPPLWAPVGEGAVGDSWRRGECHIIWSESLGVLIGKPRQGHTKVIRQVWGRAQQRPCPASILCPFTQERSRPVGRKPRVGPRGLFSPRGASPPLPQTKPGLSPECSPFNPYCGATIGVQLPSTSYLVGAPQVQLNGWTEERATAVTSQGIHATGDGNSGSKNTTV